MTMEWMVHAIRYAEGTRLLRDALLGGLAGPEGDAAIGMAYHVFVVHGPAGAFVLDTGADRAAIETRRRTFVQPVEAGLAALGIGQADIIQTHLHWDHAGNHGLLPDATVWLQRREMAYAATQGLADPWLRAGYDAADIGAMAARIARGKVRLIEQAASPADGLTLHHVGGHTDGLMILRARTRRGWMVLAGDAVVYRANLARRLPFPQLFHAGDALAAIDTCRALADAEALIVPGHDPALTPQPVTRLD
jgi:glyoxylase-like metal-dependent hydrolase (beta-lactamase superfamily II)